MSKKKQNKKLISIIFVNLMDILRDKRYRFQKEQLFKDFPFYFM